MSKTFQQDRKSISTEWKGLKSSLIRYFLYIFFLFPPYTLWKERLISEERRCGINRRRGNEHVWLNLQQWFKANCPAQLTHISSKSLPESWLWEEAQSGVCARVLETERLWRVKQDCGSIKYGAAQMLSMALNSLRACTGLMCFFWDDLLTLLVWPSSCFSRFTRGFFSGAFIFQEMAGMLRFCMPWDFWYLVEATYEALTVDTTAFIRFLAAWIRDMALSSCRVKRAGG